MKGNKTMRFEIELPEKYCDVISITAVGAKGTVIDLLARVITIQGHSGETLVIPENGDARWETPIMFNKTMEQIVKKEEEQAKRDEAWRNIKKLLGEEAFEALKKPTISKN